MKVRYPDHYKKFQCIAGACPDTCCAGWEIAVDPVSEERYRDAQKQLKKTKPEFARKLKKYVQNGYIISEDVTCPFLNRDGLCEMYIELGPDSLCHTCKRHPRHMEDYGDLHEVMLLMSCPEAARLILEENDGGFYTRELPERHGNMDGIDEELLEILLEARDVIWKVTKSQVIQDHVKVQGEVSSPESVMAFSLALAHDIQRRLANEEYEAVRTVIRRYGKEGALAQFLSQWIGRGDRKALMDDFRQEFVQMDTICREWPKLLENCGKTVNEIFVNMDVYEEKWKEFQEQNPHLTNGWMYVFRYFLYSFMLSALYDNDVLTKIKMAVLCTIQIMELDFADWMEEKVPDRILHCYALARQVENSDENRRSLEHFLKQKSFPARRIIDVLIR